MKPVLRTQREINALNQARVLISGAIAQIDLRGTNVQVTAAMMIVDDAISALIQGGSPTPEKICRTAIRKSKIQIEPRL